MISDLVSRPDVDAPPAVLERVVLCFAPIVDRRRATAGLRLTARATDAGGVRLSDLAQVLAPTLEALAPLPVLLGSIGARLDEGLQQGGLPANALLEFDAVLAAHPGAAEPLAGLARAGVRLALRGRPRQPLEAPVRQLFECAVIHQDEDLRITGGYAGDDFPRQQRSLPFHTLGASNLLEARAAFERGSTGCIGWPVEDPLGRRGGGGAQPAQLSVLELLRLLREEAPPQRMEAVLRQDAAIAYRLLQLVNAPIMGVSLQITSLQHAIAMLGRRQLQRWLIALLCTGNRDPDVTPLVGYSICRGLLLDYLGQDSEHGLGDELFLTGAFSLLDRLTNTPFEALFRGAMVGPMTVEALRDGRGPLLPFLELARAAEDARHDRVRQRLRDLDLPLLTYNRALLRALAEGWTITRSL
jgi:EAL and modified HD-GYP domain-containing signal transduction protein